MLQCGRGKCKLNLKGPARDDLLIALGFQIANGASPKSWRFAKFS
jgi:hypothetical protein